MAEKNQRAFLARQLKKLDFRAVENKIGKGTPDNNYVDGWVELKWLESWPVRDHTRVSLDHFTKEQKLWLRRRWRRFGVCFVCIQQREEWLLICGCDVAPVGTLSRNELYSLAVLHLKKWDRAEFVRTLTAPYNYLQDQRKLKGICGLPFLKSSSSTAADAASRSERSQTDIRSPSTSISSGRLVFTLPASSFPRSS